MSVTQRKQTSIRFIDAASVCQPAVRMVVVEAWAGVDSDTGERFDGHEFHPVVGLSAVAVREFSRAGDHAKPATPVIADREGWRLCQSGVEYSPLVVDEHYEVVDLQTLRELTASQWVAVACPWPPAEDDVRLSEHVVRLTRYARQTGPEAGPVSDVRGDGRSAGRPTPADAGDGQPGGSGGWPGRPGG